MSNDEPMLGPSVPGNEVCGPQDLAMRMNVATSDDWDQIPLPARQQLGWHEPYERDGAVELKDYLGKSPQELVHSEALSGSSPEGSLNLVQSVTYHLESTPPPAEPPGAPGSDGYNRLNRGVPPASGFEHPADYTLEQGAGVRTFRLPEGVGSGTSATRQVFDQTPDVNDPYRNSDGSLKDPGEVWQAAPAQPEGGATDFASGTPERVNTEAETVPNGSVGEVLQWVGDDADRARSALEFEQSKHEPRSTLIRQLNDKL